MKAERRFARFFGVIGAITCLSSSVLAQVIQGAHCDLNNICAEGLFCVDGYCCNTECSGPCEACNGSDRRIVGARNGTCSPAPAGFPGDPSCGKYVCDGTPIGICPIRCASSQNCARGYYCVNNLCQPRAATGKACPSACQDGTCEGCSSGFCADGVCCDQACDGPCVACSKALKGDLSADGICGNVLQGTRGRSLCPIKEPNNCEETGLCDGQGRCAYYDEKTVCQGPICIQGTEITSHCDGAGNCAFDVEKHCAAGCANDKTCKPDCSDDGGCDPGASCAAGRCDAGACTGSGCDAGADASPPPAARCFNEATVSTPDGGLLECRGHYACRGGQCLTRCESPDDCVAPALCDLDKRCKVPDTHPPTAFCSVFHARRSRGAGSEAVLASLAGLGAVWLSRRRRQEP